MARRPVKGVERTCPKAAAMSPFGPRADFEARDLLDLGQDRSGLNQLGLKAQQEAMMTEKIKSEVISRRRVFSLVGLAASGLVLATIPVSPQVTSRGVELSVDQAQAVTYRRARVTARRVNRRAYRRGVY
jgi:hypothetical protein